MTVIASKLYKALKILGIDDELAEQASAEVAESTKIVLEQKVNLAELKSDIKELRTNVKILITLNVAMLAGMILTVFGVLFSFFIK